MPATVFSLSSSFHASHGSSSLSCGAFCLRLYKRATVNFFIRYASCLDLPLPLPFERGLLLPLPRGAADSSEASGISSRCLQRL